MSLFRKKQPDPPRKGSGLLISILLVVIPVLLLGLFFLFREDREAMDWIITNVTDPYKHFIAGLCDRIPVSMAEVLWLIAIVGAVVFLARTVWLLIKRPGKLLRLVRRVLALCSALLFIYCGYTLLWGINFYGTGFDEQAGLTRRGASTEELYELTAAFADKVNELSSSVDRNEDGTFALTADEVFDRSEGLFDGIAEEYPFLEGTYHRPKGMVASRLMSLIGYTGFYFPFTAESNLNIDPPACLLPATVAHELSHQRNVTDEDEANFTAILACLRCDDPAYQYSGALLGYIHLSNALFKADKSLWTEVRKTLNEEVCADLSANNSYWESWESSTVGSAAKSAADTVYSGFSASYGEENVMKRYEACVELLVAYYFDK